MRTKAFTKLLALSIALIMVFGVLPLSVLAAASGTTDNSEFQRIFLLDCGRKYFTVAEIEGIIDTLAANHYTHIELAFGNEGLRFLLDDMSLKVNGKEFATADVTAAIQYGNSELDYVNDVTDSSDSEWTESQMDSIIAHAKKMGIEVVPLLNAPGHTYTIIKAMEQLGLGTLGKQIGTATGSCPNWAIDVTKTDATAFVEALLKKYVSYFKDKGCTLFNIGADESGISTSNYLAYAKLVNAHAEVVKAAGMTPMAFNDGIYDPAYTSALGTYEFHKYIAISYWTHNNYATAAALANKGHKINSTHNNWYYVLGNNNSTWAGYNTAINNMSTVKCTSVDSGYTTDYGCTLAVWCDKPSVEYSANKSNVETLIKTFAAKNPDYFKETPKPVVEINVSPSNVITVGEKVTFTVSTGATAKWSVDNSDVLELGDSNTNGSSIIATAKSDGNATVTATVDGADYKVQVKVNELSISSANGSVLVVNGSTELSLAANEEVTWESSDTNVVELEAVAKAATRSSGITGTSVTAKAVGKGSATVTATTASDKKYTIDLEVTDKVYEERSITITVGQTQTDTIVNKDYSGSYTTDEPDIATVVSAEYTKTDGKSEFVPASSVSSNTGYYIKSSDGKYLDANAKWVDDIDKAVAWTLKTSYYGNADYYLQNGSSYLRYNSGWTTTTLEYYAAGIYFNNGTFYRTRSWSYGSGGYTYSNPIGTPGTKKSGAPVDQTVITFKGLKEGTTHVIVGDEIRYTITVIKEDLSNVTKLPIQLWITNNTIEADGTTATKTGSGWGGNTESDKPVRGRANYVGVDAKVAYDEKGVPLADAIGLTEPLTRYEWGGTRFIVAQYDKAAQNLVLWSGRIHKSSDSNIQTVWGTDYSNEGTQFSYVRYWGQKWQVSDDRVNWVTVTGAGSTGTCSGCTEQLAAYYMTRTDITTEVTTDVADWGEPKDGTKYDSQVSGDFVLLDFAVKYASGTLTPDKFPVSKKTLAYHCSYNSNGGPVKQDSNSNYYRQLNNFRGVNSAEYEIYMVTVTMTDDSATKTLSSTEAKSGYTYDGKEQIVWAIDADTRTNSGLADYTSISESTVYSGCKIGGTPDIRGIEVYNKHGALITYYVRTKEVPKDKLTVHYVDKGTGRDFYFYNIIVKPNTVFDAGFGPKNPKNLVLENNTVMNYHDKTEVVSANLSTMPLIPAKYRYAVNYDCVETRRSEDGKEVWLYYTFKTDKTFVVDFGITLKIALEDISEALKTATINGVAVKNTDNAEISYSIENGKYVIVYKLKNVLNGEDRFDVTVTGQIEVDGKVQIGDVTYTVKIIPASTVYYEDSFVNFTNGQKELTDAKWKPEGTVKNVNQALEELGKSGLYGTDNAYADSTEYSMGSAHKVTVTKAMFETWKAGANKQLSDWPQAKFTFKGTGFDIISLTDNTSGAIYVDIYKGTDTSKDAVVGYVVNNYYGYSYDKETDTWKPAPSASSNALYQIPVIKAKGLEYGEYTVVVTCVYSNFYDKTGEGKYSFWLDAIRVYDPLGKDNDTYVKDGEGYPQFIELSEQLRKSNFNGLVFIDGKEEAEITDYKNYGPNHEVYLAKGQALAFSLSNLNNVASVQLALKAVNGTVSYTINGEEQTVSTATDMYYDITDAAKNGGTVVITNTGDNILSLTNVKVTYTTAGNKADMTMTEAQKTQAVEMVRAMFAPAVFEPSRFEAAWSSNNVKAGRRAYLTVKTSADVEAITVNGETVTTYITRTERKGWGWNATRVTYREFIWSVTAEETADYTVAAVNSDGVASEPVTVTLTVQPKKQQSSWWDRFSRWF